jgi:hypothetical protein
MSMPFPPERENDVTTLPFAGQYQRFTAALPPFAAALLLFFRLPEDVDFLRLDAVAADFEPVVGRRVLALFLLGEAVLGGLLRRSFWPGKIV